MRTTTISMILVLALVQMASAAQTLTINGEALDAITLKTGQACTVEVVSDNSNPYSAYVGFDDSIVLGSFSHQQTMPEAGDLGAATEYNVPTFYGYFITAAGSSPSPTAGVHFVFNYNPSTVGITTLKLYDATLTVLLDSVEITVLESAIGTSITYQGRLMENNDVADGLYDLRFELYDSPSHGSLIGSIVEANDLDVVDGYFTTELDFEDPEAFNGEGRWLKIGIREWDSSDPNGYTVLNPWQRIAATPHALGLRGVYVDSDENIGMGTTSPTGRLHVDGGKAEDHVDGSNISIKAQDGGDRPSGGIGFDGYPGGDIILMPGDGGLGPLGTPGPSGYVGIGTSNPLHDLHVYDSAGHTYVKAESESGYAFFQADGNYNSGLTIKENGTTKADIYWNTANDSLGLAEGGVERLAVKGGNVGIGTTNPSEKLDVEGNIDVSSNQIKNYYGFPRPNYDSGWIELAEGEFIDLNHNLGGNIDNYVMDLTFKFYSETHNIGIGRDWSTQGMRGSYWRGLTGTSVRVYRETNDFMVQEIRLRIWVYN